MPKDLNIENSLDNHLKPVKDSDGIDSALEISTEDVRVKNLTVSGTTTGISASDDTKLPLAGGTMTGDIAMSDAGITNVKELTLAAGEDGISLDGGSSYIQEFKDEDNMASNSDTAICSQQSIKAYVDSGAGVTASTISNHTQIVYKAGIAISEAEFNALHTTPKVIVAAAGAGKVIIPLNAYIFVNRDASTTQSVSGATLAYYYAGASGAPTSGKLLAQIRRFMWNETGDRTYTFGSGLPFEAYPDDDVTNMGISLALTSAVTSGSIDNATLYMNYTIADFS